MTISRLETNTSDPRSASRDALRMVRHRLLMTGCAFSFRYRRWRCPSCRRQDAMSVIPRADGGVTLRCLSHSSYTGNLVGCSQGHILDALGLLFRDVGPAQFRASGGR